MEDRTCIETERLVLRKFTNEDAKALLRILGDPEVNTFLPMFLLHTLEEAENYLQEQYLEKYRKNIGIHYAVCRKPVDEPIGYVNIQEDDSHDLGYGLRREFWRKGIMTEAVRAVVNVAKEMGLPYLTATHDVHNPRSGAVMKKIGMTYQYTYQELWQPKNILVNFRMYQLNLDGNKKRVYKAYWDRYPIHFIENHV